MTNSEINKLHKSMATDFKLAIRKTELWTVDYCHQVLHDIKKFLTFGYLESVSLILSNRMGVPLKAKKYLFGSTSRNYSDRPGRIDWEEGDGQSLIVLLNHTESYNSLGQERKIQIQRELLKLQWHPSSIDGNFPHLSSTVSKRYTHESGGIDRHDFN